jgi:hypothetical protein
VVKQGIQVAEVQHSFLYYTTRLLG